MPNPKQLGPFEIRVLNDTLRELQQSELNQWAQMVTGALTPQNQQMHQMFHFFEQPETPNPTVQVDVEQPSTKPCKFLSEIMRESSETGLITGTQETCAHPNHEELIRLRKIVMGLSSMLRILVTRSRVQFHLQQDIAVDPSVPLIRDILDLGQTLDEFVASLNEPPSPQRSLRYLEEGVLNVCHALDQALREKGRVAEFSSDDGQMTDQFSGTSK